MIKMDFIVETDKSATKICNAIVDYNQEDKSFAFYCEHGNLLLYTRSFNAVMVNNNKLFTKNEFTQFVKHIKE